MRVCSMANCSRPTSQYGKLCSAHRNHQRRHGDPLQIPVTKQDLKPYLRLIQERRKRNTDSPLWGMIDSRWLSVVDNAQQSLRLARSGKAGNRHGRLAAAAIEQLSQTSDRTEIADTAMAMFILQEFEPAASCRTGRFGISLRGVPFVLVISIVGAELTIRPTECG